MQKLEKQYHIHCAEGDVGRYVILPGDPGRCEKIAELFDEIGAVGDATVPLPYVTHAFRAVKA